MPELSSSCNVLLHIILQIDLLIMILSYSSSSSTSLKTSLSPQLYFSSLIHHQAGMEVMRIL